MSRDGTFYLNKSGSRWICLEKGKKPKVVIQPDNHNNLEKPIVRTAVSFEMFGNFSCVNYWYKKRLRSTLHFTLLEPTE